MLPPISEASQFTGVTVEVASVLWIDRPDPSGEFEGTATLEPNGLPHAVVKRVVDPPLTTLSQQQKLCKNKFSAKFSPQFFLGKEG